MQLPPTAIIAFGAISAALVAGFFSLMNIVLAKEQKVSEFRQQWINDLRSDLAQFSSLVVTISGMHISFRTSAGLRIGESSPPDRLGEFHRERVNEFIDVGMLYGRIRLRLNPDEHEDLLDSIEALNMCLETTTPFDSVSEKRDEMIAAAVTTIKTEWKRVKRGEREYRIMRNVAISLVGVTLIGIGGWAAYYASRQLKTPKHPDGVINSNEGKGV